MLPEDGSSTIFLHERISPNGVRRFVLLQFRPNVDHAQLCSIDCYGIQPATFFSQTVVENKSVDWVPGSFASVDFKTMSYAQADPADASHFVFRYKHDPHFLEESKNATETSAGVQSLQEVIIDGWLRDDGTIQLKIRGKPNYLGPLLQ